jgi:predicted RNA-binding Zn-ribbon protein involved in translation (DUF1610 family)
MKMAKKTKYLFKCPECGELVERIIEYATCIATCEITLDGKGKPHWSKNSANEEDGDFLKLECPQCGEELEQDISDIKIKKVG